MFSIDIGGVPLPHCLSNASGICCTDQLELETLSVSKYTGMVVTKTATLHPRKGNSEPRYHFDKKTNTSINSTGVANHGVQYYTNCAQVIQSDYNPESKPFIISLLAMNHTDYVDLICEVIEDDDVDGIELNVSCPNLCDDKMIIGYDVEVFEKVLKALVPFIQNRQSESLVPFMVGIKLPPYFDSNQFDIISNLLKKYQNIITYIVCINSLPGGLFVDPDEEKVMILPNSGIGGLGGKSILSVGLSNVRNFAKRLAIPIVACGGITSGEDVVRYCLCGATAFQIGTQLKEEGIGVFCRISNELEQILIKKGCSHIHELKGRLLTDGFAFMESSVFRSESESNLDFYRDMSPKMDRPIDVFVPHQHPVATTIVTRKFEDFCKQEGLLRVHTQSRLSILAACEDPKTVATYEYLDQTWPLPQTGQMWLEYEMLRNPHAKGFYCTSTSYRNEPNPVPGRHNVIFDMLEFELKGDINELTAFISRFLDYLGFKRDTASYPGDNYETIASKYGVSELSNDDETRIGKDYGPVFLLKNFPERTDPFWNMRRNDDNSGTARKIDVIMHGIETIGSAERSCNPTQMKECFHTISKGEYSKLLFDLFGKDRVEQELDEFLQLKFIPRSGGGIGMNRLIRALELSDLLFKDYEKFGLTDEDIIAFQKYNEF